MKKSNLLVSVIVRLPGQKKHTYYLYYKAFETEQLGDAITEGDKWYRSAINYYYPNLSSQVLNTTLLTDENGYSLVSEVCDGVGRVKATWFVGDRYKIVCEEVETVKDPDTDKVSYWVNEQILHSCPPLMDSKMIGIGVEPILRRPMLSDIMSRDTEKEDGHVLVLKCQIPLRIYDIPQQKSSVYWHVVGNENPIKYAEQVYNAYTSRGLVPASGTHAPLIDPTTHLAYCKVSPTEYILGHYLLSVEPCTVFHNPNDDFYIHLNHEGRFVPRSIYANNFKDIFPEE